MGKTIPAKELKERKINCDDQPLCIKKSEEKEDINVFFITFFLTISLDFS